MPKAKSPSTHNWSWEAKPSPLPPGKYPLSPPATKAFEEGVKLHHKLGTLTPTKVVHVTQPATPEEIEGLAKASPHDPVEMEGSDWSSGIMTVETLEKWDAEMEEASAPLDEPHAPTSHEGGHNMHQQYTSTWPETQKARGVLWLAWHGLAKPVILGGLKQPWDLSIYPHPPTSPPPLRNIQQMKDGIRWFARPCPSKPQHGFIESRVLLWELYALNLICKVRDVDPKGEIILMPKLSGKYSAVATNAGVAYGNGRDGATGTGDIAFIPAFIPVPEWNSAIAGSLPVTNVGIQSCSYLEMVEHEGSLVMVQLRDGPEQSSVLGNFVPKAFKLERFISPAEVHFDLTKWATLVKKQSKKPGVAILIRSEPNRASHFAVHGILAGMPVLFSKALADPAELIGQKIKATEGEEPSTSLGEEDYAVLGQEVMRCLIRRRPISGGEDEESSCLNQNRVAASIGTCHAMMGWGAERHLLRLRAEGITTCLLYTIAACFGEVRHFYRVGPGRPGLGNPRKMLTDLGSFLASKDVSEMKDVPEGEEDEEDTHPITRDLVYSSISQVPLGRQMVLLKTLAKDLRGPNWDGAYGGLSWSKSAILVRQLGIVLIQFCQDPNEARWQKAAILYNRTINACHNGGKVLTKWIDGFHFNHAAATPSLCFFSPYAARIVLGLEVDNGSITQLRADFEHELNTSEVKK